VQLKNNLLLIDIFKAANAAFFMPLKYVLLSKVKQIKCQEF